VDEQAPSTTTTAHTAHKANLFMCLLSIIDYYRIDINSMRQHCRARYIGHSSKAHGSFSRKKSILCLEKERKGAHCLIIFLSEKWM
jgi:hypothetical protein